MVVGSQAVVNDFAWHVMLTALKNLNRMTNGSQRGRGSCHSSLTGDEVHLTSQ